MIVWCQGSPTSRRAPMWGSRPRPFPPHGQQHQCVGGPVSQKPDAPYWMFASTARRCFAKTRNTLSAKFGA